MSNSSNSTKYLIIGSSAAGITAALELRKLDPSATITCITREVELPYNKCWLVDYIAGARDLNSLYLHTPEFLAQQQISLINNCTVREIRPGPQQVLLNLSSGLPETGQPDRPSNFTAATSLNYQYLLIATGVRPWVPPIVGLAELLADGRALNFYNLHDSVRLQAQIDQLVSQQKAPHVTVIGAGLTGLECADALWRRGLQVTVVDQNSQVLGQLLDQSTAQVLQAQIASAGIVLHLGAPVAQISTQANSVSARPASTTSTELAASVLNLAPIISTPLNSGNSQLQVSLTNGQQFQTNLVLLATGVQANQIPIAGPAQLTTVKNQIQVDQFFATNLAKIWAAGDAILVSDRLTGQLTPNRTWPEAVLHGRLAARNMYAVASQQPVSNWTSYPGQIAYYQSQLFKLALVTCGIVDGSAGRSYNAQGQLQGFTLLGDISMAAKLRRQLGQHVAQSS